MSKPNTRQQVRIIAGEWRSRKLTFPAIEGLRPSGDRMREMLFNWLNPYLPGAQCLDLFAGSGALGFEAASRGAKAVLMVEQHPQVIQALKASQQLLQASQVSIQSADALRLIQQPGQCFDVVFLDPPFQLNCLQQVCAALEQQHWVAGQGMVYLEYPLQQWPALPANWQVFKHKQAGNVHAVLAKRGD